MRIYPERAYNFINRTGIKYGRLTVLGLAPKPKGCKRSYWFCKCECGTEITVDGAKLGIGHTQSCGCLQRERLSLARKTHGMSNNCPEYGVWLNMKARCTHKSVDSYYLYGARGIRVCRRWMKFENFIADMGRRPSKDHSIERRDYDKNYCPSNCTWATRIVQANNKRNNRHLTYNGTVKTIAEWARHYGVDYKRFWKRINSGLGIEAAIA